MNEEEQNNNLPILSRDSHRHKRILNTAHWCSPAALFWLSSYIASHCLAMVPQSGAKENF
jgi:hypothetical protein